jgi:AcrR family transcriptional regulator
MNKNPGKTELTQQNIQEAFWTLYTKQSIDKITVKDICNLAGYNRSTFYQYYVDVYDVLHKIENRLLEEIDEFVLKFMRDAGNLNASLAIQAVFELFEQLNQYVAVLFGSHGDAEFTGKVSENLKPLWIKYFLPKSNYSPAEVDLLLEYCIIGLLSMYQKWFYDHNGVSAERIIQLSFLTLPDTSVFESFDKELRET